MHETWGLWISDCLIMSKKYLYSSIGQIRYVIIRIIVGSARASQKDWEIEPSDLWPMNRNTLVLYIYIYIGESLCYYSNKHEKWGLWISDCLIMSKKYLYSSIFQIRYVIIRIIVGSARASQKDCKIEPSDLWPINRNTLVIYIYIYIYEIKFYKDGV